MAEDNKLSEEEKEKIKNSGLAKWWVWVLAFVLVAWWKWDDVKTWFN